MIYLTCKGDDVMASLTSPINIMVDTETKEQASSILKDLGLNMSTAINIFLRQVIKKDGLPFEVTNSSPSKSMLQALREAEDIKNNPDKYKGYNDVDEFIRNVLDED